MPIEDFIGGSSDGIDLANPKAKQIVAAATDLFFAHGYDGCSMDAVSREAKVSKATLYAHFSNKETLFATLVREEVKSITERLRPPTLDQTDLESSLRQIADQFIDLFLGPRGLEVHRLIFAEATRFPEIGRIFATWGPRRLRRMISDLLRDARQRGLIDLPDPDLAAIHLLSLISGDLPMERQLGIASPSATEMKRLSESGISLFLKGYAVESEATANRRKHVPKPLGHTLKRVQKN